MSRNVEVVLLSDIVENGAVAVAAGTEGYVTQASLPATLRQYTVTFQGSTPVSKTVSASQIRFRDGVLGPVRALMVTTGGFYLNDIDYTTFYSHTDLVVDGSLTYFGGSITMTSEDGTVLVVSADANGDIDIKTTFK
jgi:hypothetical protein